jgi:hypothetical protein
VTLTNVLLVAASGTTKTGPIPVTYRPQETCPSTCPLLKNGCYGEGRIFHHAERAVTMSTEAVYAKLRQAPKYATILRDRIVGDLVTPEGTFDWEYLLELAWAARNEGLTPFGYSHAWRMLGPDDVATIKESGYVLNASCETEQDVIDATALGLPVVLTGDHWVEGSKIAKRRVMTCPAQTEPDTTCSTCKLCSLPNRNTVIRFLIHGPTRRKARATIAALTGDA